MHEQIHGIVDFQSVHSPCTLVTIIKWYTYTWQAEKYPSNECSPNSTLESSNDYCLGYEFFLRRPIESLHFQKSSSIPGTAENNQKLAAVAIKMQIKNTFKFSF